MNETRVRFVFDFEKTLQAVAFLLKLAPDHKMKHLRLLKLLYMADRESLRDTGRPITGDTLTAMPKGPVLSNLFDIIKGGDDHSPDFAKYVRWARAFHNVILLNDPGTDRLSKYNTEKLKEIYTRYQDYSRWKLVEMTHQLPEWIKNNPGNSSRPIPFEDVLEGAGKLDQVDEIRDNAEIDQAFANTFGG